MTLIHQSNARLWQAIAVCRIDRNPATVCEVRDAINWRDDVRRIRLTEGERARIAGQVRAFGRVENWRAVFIP